MKNRWWYFFLIIPFLWCNTSSAVLLDRGGGMVYDTELDITWLQDPNYAMTSGYDSDGLMNWNDANAWADSFSFGGYEDWRLPTHNSTNPRPETADPTNEIGYLWHQLSGGDYIFSDTDISPFLDIPWQETGYAWYWTASEYAEDPTRAWRMTMDCACWDNQDKSDEYYVWLVRSGDVANIPEPASLLLLGIGLIGLSWARKIR